MLFDNFLTSPDKASNEGQEPICHLIPTDSHLIPELQGQGLVIHREDRTSFILSTPGLMKLWRNCSLEPELFNGQNVLIDLEVGPQEQGNYEFKGHTYTYAPGLTNLVNVAMYRVAYTIGNGNLNGVFLTVATIKFLDDPFRPIVDTIIGVQTSTEGVPIITVPIKLVPKELISSC